MSSAVKVSVVIPVYNTEKYLPACLDSILGQSLKDIEVICVNDGSRDGSLSVLEAYAARDARLTVISQENRGQSTARNAGMDKARGEYLCFCDSDDMLTPDALETLYSICRDKALDVLYFDAELRFEDNALKERFASDARYFKGRAGIREVCTGPELLTLLCGKHMYRVSPCLQLTALDYLRRTGIRFYEGIVHEDNPFTFAVMLRAKRAMKLDRAYYLRLYRAGSVMTTAESFENLYGYLKSLQLMTETARSVEAGAECQQAMAAVMSGVYYHVRRIYALLPDGERDKCETMPPLDRFWLRLALGGQSSLDSEAAEIRASVSYKIGRVITFVPRKLRGGVRCLREHGGRYTLHRVKQKFLSLFGGEHR